MEIKALQIEIVLTEMLAERGKIIIQQNDTIVAANKEIESLRAELETLKTVEVV